MQHDERFKLLLQEFLREFFELFLPELVPQLDFTNARWLQQELISDPPGSEKRIIDMLVELPVLGGPTAKLVFIHIEVEADDTVLPLRRRMFHYFYHLTQVLGLEVLPLAVYLNVGLQGRGRDRFVLEVFDRTPLCFEYDYVGLPALQGADYLIRDNVLGLALSTLMRWPETQRVEAALEALDRIVHSAESPRRKILLCDCINAYAPLDETQRIELNTLLREPKRKEILMFGKTWYEQGEEQGIEKGEQRGQRKILLTQLEDRFGSLTDTVRQRLETWPVEKLTDLGRALLRAQSLRDLGLED